MTWDGQVEKLDRPQLEALQLERLQKAVHRAYENIPLYRKKFDEAGVKPSDIRTLQDIRKLPFTVKDDFRDSYPFGLFAVPQSEIVRVHASSGTTGKPTVVGYTRNDIDMWSEVVMRTLLCGGATRDDVIQVAYGYGLFTGGLGLHYGAERLGAMVVPVSGGNTKRQIMLMQDFGTSLLCCTPSYSLLIAEVMGEMGVDPAQLNLRVGYFGAEPWTDSIRRQIEDRLKLKALDIYGLSEVIGPGVASECLEQNGLHIFEDHFLPEVIDPDTLEPLPPGEKGELVFTCLTKEATALIRYRTRDLSALHYEKCGCGRTLVRMERVTGRTDDMLIIRGVNVFPSQIETVLLQIEGTEPHYQLIVDKAGALDELEVRVEVSEKHFSDEVKHLEELRKKIAHELYSALNVSAKVTLVEPRTIERSMGKAVRVIDKRKKD